MKVSQLIEILQDLDEDAEVLIMFQQNYPFELAISGVTTREELGEVGLKDGARRNDVFIVDGAQQRYGNPNAWKVAIE